MSKPTVKTYQRLVQKTLREMTMLQPGADPKIVEKLNKRFKKYSKKVENYSKKQHGTA